MARERIVAAALRVSSVYMDRAGAIERLSEAILEALREREAEPY